MSSARLSLSPSPPHTSTLTQCYPPPLHVAFAPLNGHTFDILATLSTFCTVGLWKIRTPLAVEKGRQDAVIPTLLWRGGVGESEWVRQVCVREGEGEGEWVVSVLGEREGEGNEKRMDVLCFTVLLPTIPPASPSSLRESAVESETGSASLLSVVRTWEVPMPGRGGRIVEDEGGNLADGRRGVVWEAKDGGLWEGAASERL